jgi:hypothetical protein
MPSDVASDERLQSLLLPFAAFLALTTAIIHFIKRSLQPEPPQFALLKATATEAISQRRVFANKRVSYRATDRSGPTKDKREEKRQPGSHLMSSDVASDECLQLLLLLLLLLLLF